MKKTKLYSAIAIWTLSAILIAMSFMSFTTPNTFCKGWDEGYQQALEDCWKVSVSPICPIEPINSSGYKTGYGMGYAQAKEDYCDN